MNTSDILTAEAVVVVIFNLYTRLAAVSTFIRACVLFANGGQNIEHRAALFDRNGCFCQDIATLRKKWFLFRTKLVDVVEDSLTAYFNCAGYCFDF